MDRPPGAEIPGEEIRKMIPSHIKSLILDMDGVIWRGDAPIGDLPAIFNRIREHGLKYVFATNNGTRTSDQYVTRLSSLGVEVEPWQVVTSAQALSYALSLKFPRGTKVFMIGGDGVRKALEENGYDIVPIENAPSAEVVVMGIDSEISFQKMSEATYLVHRGVPFYATNPDKTFPTPRGEIPGAGAWYSVVVTATGIQPIIAGKPFPFLMDLSLERLGTQKAATLVVGDRIETDIAGGQAVGCPTALVLSGVSTREQALAWTPPPDIVVNSLANLFD
jgi:4-nitrophenyl phosphatase